MNTPQASIKKDFSCHDGPPWQCSPLSPMPSMALKPQAQQGPFLFGSRRSDTSLPTVPQDWQQVIPARARTFNSNTGAWDAALPPMGVTKSYTQIRNRNSSLDNR